MPHTYTHMSQSRTHSRTQSASSSSGFSRTLSRTYSWIAEKPPQIPVPAVNLNFFLYSHAEATIPPMELEAELTAIGDQQSHDLCAKMSGIDFNDVFICPTLQCRQSVFPLCHMRKYKYKLEWSLMDRISSQRQIQHLDDGGGDSSVVVPGPLQYITKREHRKYKPLIRKEALTKSKSTESTHQVSARLAAFVDEIYGIYLEKMLDEMETETADSSDDDGDDDAALASIQSDLLATHIDLKDRRHRSAATDASAAAVADSSEFDAELAEINALIKSSKQTMKCRSRMYSKNILICASPHTIDRLMVILNHRFQPNHHHHTLKSKVPTIRAGQYECTSMDHLQLFSGV